jgi:hypothetical protein
MSVTVHSNSSASTTDVIIAKPATSHDSAESNQIDISDDLEQIQLPPRIKNLFTFVVNQEKQNISVKKILRISSPFYKNIIVNRTTYHMI